MSERCSRLDTSKFFRDDLIYLAGLVDGDGCFFISKRTLLTAAGCPQYMMKLQIHCIDEPFIDALKEKFGGVKIVYRKPAPRNWLYGIEFTGNLLTDIAERLLPFLRLKKAQCENLLEMRRTYNGVGGCKEVPKEVLDIRTKCFERSRELNTHKPIKVLPPCHPPASSSKEIQVN